MKIQRTNEQKANHKSIYKSIHKSMMSVTLAMCLLATACGPGDPSGRETKTESLETVVEDSTTVPIQETQETVEETIEETTEETTEAIDVSAWGEPIEEIGGDWNEDQSWDLLRIYSPEIEGIECQVGFQLSISGRPSYIATVPGVLRFEDFFRGDFDGDKEQEYAVVFDLGAQGARGGGAMILLDYVENQWVDVTGQDVSSFTGFSYNVVYDAAGGYGVTGKESGEEHFLPCNMTLQNPEYKGGGVTSFYNLTLVEGENQDYLELWQYVFGESTSNHIGDVVTTISIKDGDLMLEDEITVQESVPLCHVRQVGDQLEVLPIEHVSELDTNRLEELQNEGWNLDKLFFDDILRYYEVPYYEEMVTVSLQDTTRYYEIYDLNHMVRVEREDMYFRGDSIEQSGRYHIYLDGDKVTCIMLDPFQ